MRILSVFCVSDSLILRHSLIEGHKMISVLVSIDMEHILGFCDYFGFISLMLWGLGLFSWVDRF